MNVDFMEGLYSPEILTTCHTMVFFFVACQRCDFVQLKGEITGKATVITADLTIAYVDGSRRRLQVTTGENDVPSETTAESTIVLLQGPCSLPSGRLDEVKTTPCTGSSDKRLMRCLSTGWEILVECPTQTIQQDILVTETDGNHSDGGLVRLLKRKTKRTHVLTF